MICAVLIQPPCVHAVWYKLYFDNLVTFPHKIPVLFSEQNEQFSLNQQLFSILSSPYCSACDPMSYLLDSIQMLH